MTREASTSQGHDGWCTTCIMAYLVFLGPPGCMAAQSRRAAQEFAFERQRERRLVGTPVQVTDATSGIAMNPPTVCMEKKMATDLI